MKKIFLFLLLVLLPFVVFALPVGDVDGNGSVSASDYILIRKHILNTSVLTGDKLTRADVDYNGKVNSSDYIMIRKIILGTITVTPEPTQVPTLVPTPVPTSVPTKEPVLPQLPTTVNPGLTKTIEYNSDTFKYWIEHGSFSGSSEYYKKYGSTNIFLTHIWLKDPANQIKIALGGGTTLGNNQPKTIIQNEINRNGYANKGMISVNSSFFGDSNITEWGKSQSGRVLIYNGILIRDDCKKDFGSGKVIYSSYGVTRDGELKFYNTGRMNVCESSKQQMINDGVKYSGVAHAEIGKGYIDNAKQGYSRTMICPINKNNVVIISAYNLKFDSAANIAYNTLGCQTLINLDGGGSTTLIYKDKTNKLNNSFLTNRSVADMLYFVEQ